MSDTATSGGEHNEHTAALYRRVFDDKHGQGSLGSGYSGEVEIIVRTAFLAAALLAAAPLPALADDQPVPLLQGHDYILTAMTRYTVGQATLFAPDHVTVVVSIPAYPDGDGAEFRAQTSATYWLRIETDPDHPDDVPGVGVEPDCPVRLTTPCHLALNHTRTVALSWAHDGDSFRVRLNAGRRYRFDVQGDEVVTTLLDLRGRELATTGDIQGQGTLLFRPRTTGDYVLRLQNWYDEHGNSVVVSMRLAP